MMVTTVVGRADVGAIGGSDVALGGNYVEDQVACSRSIRGAGGNRTLNTGFSGFFKASKHFWIWASPVENCMNVGMLEEMGTDDTLIIIVIVQNYTLDHMFIEYRYHCDNNWAVGINDGAVRGFDFATYGSCSNCLSNGHLTRLEDNTEH
uniref:Uncharacterized protein n=1 Tax=Romanomermis culicivorax TaxID=13658 RepID=A0A915J5H2_ROMCU